jgi:hypothetical protein
MSKREHVLLLIAVLIAAGMGYSARCSATA